MVAGARGANPPCTSCLDPFALSTSLVVQQAFRERCVDSGIIAWAVAMRF